MSLLDTMKYDNLIMGDCHIVTDPVLIAAGQTIARGDLLVKVVAETIAVAGAVGTVNRTVAASYVKATGEVNEYSFAAIAAEDVETTTGTATIFGYKTGMFNSNAVGFGGATLSGSRDVLGVLGIYLTTAVEA